MADNCNAVSSSTDPVTAATIASLIGSTSTTAVQLSSEAMCAIVKHNQQLADGLADADNTLMVSNSGNCVL